MKRYEVELSTTVSWVGVVEAESEAAAADKAEEQFGDQLAKKKGDFDIEIDAVTLLGGGGL